MATPRMDITSFVGKLLEQDDVDLLREGVRVLAQAVMETEVSGQIGAGPYERLCPRTPCLSSGPHADRLDVRRGLPWRGGGMDCSGSRSRPRLSCHRVLATHRP